MIDTNGWEITSIALESGDKLPYGDSTVVKPGYWTDFKKGNVHVSRILKKSFEASPESVQLFYIEAADNVYEEVHGV